ncbi:acetyl-CoA carboxylase biotin carboxylase subunit [Pseudenhygromyxa sp. WMMC2535]|uniref:acetyl-CoA carboxylase biotin carboxylase subunit n=1 Tax=Pseudenhygromyxa sp. WMMC2535 TaxID=2712867 RepID=UPI00155749E9|nr:acetyl-CoA carboxylase biotin carboxylase subunit [Pseudenhygromyxa sp. WMMC2535]NVB43425.1 acetyl-CoA carboxylase biotin carboxylase subunit [Pseudenhygromyxa sp. WMMC2535]
MSQTRAPFSKILVANRGEIALRVFRTCREHGIATVAVYSDGDRNSPHVAGADEAVHIGPTPSAQSYLRADRIIAAAKQTGAEAIHPGYGFLSERASFVEACEAAGLTFIGPGTRAMNVMGDKVRARKAMQAAGVPLVPGREDLADVNDALAAAKEIGYPLMVKASAGGGGKGMRIVHDDEALRRGFEAAQREAAAAFGDDRIFVERAVMQARHVEIQLMADSQGNVVFLNERDCSVQRRHQKVIEEAPSPGPQMTPEIRAAMGEAACKVAHAVDYVGAATVEFLFEEQADGEPRFYFLEMNTRLQVEHPVTEMTTGRDLVWDMIRVSAGQPLGYTQADIPLRGHAIECRIYAEDPLRFLPSPGPLLRLRWPEGPGLRIDAAVREGSEVSSHYDPMIAKLIAWGPTRAIALGRMRRALQDTVVLGIDCNIPFHLRVLDEPDFVAGHFDTHYIDKHQALVEAHELDEARSQVVAAAAAVAAANARRQSTSAGATAEPAGFSAWQRSVRWRG